MFDQFFGKYLLEKKYVTLSQLQSLLERLDDVRPDPGVLAIHAELMDGRQVDRVRAMQQKEKLSFEELAIREGYLKQSDLERLPEEQKKARFPLGQLLVQDGILSFSQLEKLYRDYRKDSGLSGDEIEALRRSDVNGILCTFFQMKGDPFDPYRMYVRFFLREVIRSITSNIRFGRLESVDSLMYEDLLYQKICGKDDDIALGMTGTTPDMLEFARFFAPIDSLHLDELARDAIGEFLNIQNGHYLSLLSERGVEHRLMPSEYRRNGTLTGNFILKVALYLPFGQFDIVMAENPRFEDHGEHRPDSPFRKKRVLIADDSLLSRTLLKSILTDAGYEVAGEAADGEVAVSKYLELTPDLVTMDITMPRMDGIEALKKILRLNADAKVIVMTASGQNSVMLEALKSGAKNYLVKPFDAQSILSVCKEVLER